MWQLLLGLVLANPYEGRDSVVRAEVSRTVDSVQLTSAASDLQTWETLYPADCVKEWLNSTQTAGVGGRARVTYTIGAMRRRLTVEVSKVEDGLLVDLDHLGNKGFVTRVHIDGEVVRLETFVNPPPWPLRSYFYEKLQPEWTRCQESALETLVATAESMPSAEVE